MALTSIPNISSLPFLPTADLTNLLDYLFEPSTAIHDTLLPVLRASTYPSYGLLIDACQTALFTLAALPDQSSALHSVIGSHPRLGAKKVDSAASTAEQASLAGQGEQLAKLNDEYEKTFPGLRYVVFVNGREREVIMGEMRSRIDRGDFQLEVEEALKVSLVLYFDKMSPIEM